MQLLRTVSTPPGVGGVPNYQLTVSVVVENNSERQALPDFVARLSKACESMSASCRLSDNSNNLTSQFDIHIAMPSVAVDEFIATLHQHLSGFTMYCRQNEHTAHDRITHAGYCAPPNWYLRGDSDSTILSRHHLGIFGVRKTTHFKRQSAMPHKTLVIDSAHTAMRPPKVKNLRPRKSVMPTELAELQLPPASKPEVDSSAQLSQQLENLGIAATGVSGNRGDAFIMPEFTL